MTWPGGMTYDERQVLRREIDRVKRERLARASYTSGGRDVERRRASWRAHYQRKKERKEAERAATGG